jgi:hypothetical protein
LAEFHYNYAQAIRAEVGEIRAERQISQDGVLTEDEARELAVEAERRVREGAIAFVGKRLVGESRSAVANRERTEAERKRQEAAKSKDHKKRRESWRKLYGAEIAGKLDPAGRYDLLPIEGALYAVAEGKIDRTYSVARDAGLSADRYEGAERAVPARRLHKKAEHLAGVNPSAAELRELGASVRVAKQAKKEEEAKRETERREQERELAEYGVAATD